MASLSLPRVLQQRRTTVEQERITFEKSQAIAINKAINGHEIPVKEKHVRSAIIGTFQEKGGTTFWLVVTKLPLQDNRIVAWKFCHVLHKLLRASHPKFIVHSQKHRGMLEDLGKLWCHLKEGYGRLIFLYTKFLMTKLDFHRRNPRFPGNLSVTERELEAIGDHDINNYFQLSVEMFDYLDDILALQAAVFGFLDPSKCNSMMSAGQCRLAPMIPCIQDSSHLYDYCVKILFKLHSSLPPETLMGHRDRFFKQFKILREFYLASSNLQYFKNLIQIPLLPENPPNFLIEAELKSYVTPVTVVLPDSDAEPEPEPEPEPEAEHDNIHSIDGILFENPDLNTEKFPNVLCTDRNLLLKFRTNPNMSQFLDPPVQLFNVDRTKDPDKLIDALQKEIMKLRGILDCLVMEQDKATENYNEKIVKLENDLAWKDSELIQERQLKDDLLRHTEQATKNNEYGNFVSQRNKAMEDKFQKIKDLYARLRDEHIQLIRNKADVDKQYILTKHSNEQALRLNEEMAAKITKLDEENSKLEERAADIADELRDLRSKKQSMTKEISTLSKDLKNALTLNTKLRADLDEEIAIKGKYLDKIGTYDKLREQTRAEHVRVTNEKVREMLDACLTGCEDILKLTVDEVDNPALSAFTATPDYFIKLIEPALSSVTEFEKSFTECVKENFMKGDDLVLKGIHLVYRISNYVIQGKMTSNSSRDIEFGEKIAEACKEVGTEALNLLTNVKNQKPIDEVHNDCENLKKKINEVADLMEQLTRALKGDSVDILEDLVEGELVAMEKAIEEAAKRMEEMLNESRKSHSGVKLEVNEKILDSCTNLMSAVRLLIQKSRLLQAEIVAQGKGSHSAKEFYKRNHQWTEGLISAAKAVGVGAKFLLTCADKVVSGQGKFEQLIVASQEIAASTTQLVVASRVKADRKSDNLAGLSSASKGVTQATAGVVATAKSCSQLVEESEDLDIAGMSLHQAKRLEMESQVRVLELEASLQQERQKLAVLRRRHYQLAGEGEGWEKKDME